ETGTLRMNFGEGLNDATRHTLTWAGTGTSIDDKGEFPDSFTLGNAYPNPFNPTTVIPYETGLAGQVTIRVYDILGRLVSTLYNGPQSAGKHQVRFDAAGLTSGKYLVRMEAPGYNQTRAVTLLK
ncbi:MAG: T9SS type A sorting domain-containing protein, partial [Cyclonatronaceae bacterium]